MRKKTAFSLVELSIVLIIIGLLVAGVVGGASLIQSASLRSVMSEARNYGIITNSFFVSYDALPGDLSSGFTSPSSSAISNGCVGNANGRIEFVNSASTAVTAANIKTIAEGLCATYQLKDSGMLQTEDLKSISATGEVTKLKGNLTMEVGSHYPQSRMRGNGWVLDYVSGTDETTSSDSWRSVGNEAEPSNVVFFVGEKMGAGTSTTVAELAASKPTQITPSITPTQAKAVDTKIDDGLPKSGKVRGFGRDDTGVTVATSIVDPCVAAGTGATYSSTNNYIVDNDRPSCILGFSIDILK